jgi:hypothetical protein
MTTQTDDTRRILDMVAAGKITVDEADRLLTALAVDRSTDAAAAGATTGPDARPRWFRINIRKPAKADGHAAKHVNIRVPIAVVKGGMRLGAMASFAARRRRCG